MKKSRLVIALYLMLSVVILAPVVVFAGPSPTGAITVALSNLETQTFLPWNGGGGRQPYMTTIYEYLIYFDPKT